MTGAAELVPNQVRGRPLGGLRALMRDRPIIPLIGLLVLLIATLEIIRPGIVNELLALRTP